MKTRNKLDLRLFTDDKGITWCRNESQRAMPVDQPLDEFLRSQDLVNANSIKLLGFPSNAELICKLWELRDELSADVYLGTPSVCAAGDQKDPDIVFRQMQGLAAVPASLGGMRPITQHDYLSYGLLRRLSQNEVPPVSEVAAHPAWPAVSFVLAQIRPAISDWEKLPAYLASLNVLASILDPRWYIDWGHPDRASKLKMYMGVSPKHVRNAWTGVDCKGSRGGRAASVLAAWTNGIRQRPSNGCNQFLWGVSHKGEQDVLALRASGQYLSFVQSVWLHMMRKDGRQLFIPKHFFSSPEDATSYERHQLLWETDHGEV
jgi:hypothetical protein